MARLSHTLDLADSQITQIGVAVAEVIQEILDGVEIETSFDWQKKSFRSRIVLREEDDAGN